MRFIFLDDSRQNAPTRLGMGSLVALGGFSIPAETVRGVESKLNHLCRTAGFPPKEPFKWSPGKDLWMRDGLVGEKRQQFFFDVVDSLCSAGATAFITISDAKYCTATNAKTPETDVANMILERIHLYLVRSGTDGLVIADRPGGGRADEEKFFLNCLEMMQEGAGYVVPDKICLNVVSSPAKFIRLLQAADTVVSCTLSRVAGEYTHSPPVFEKIRQILFTDGGRVGGIGLKLHPDFKYANLYHWLVGDNTFWRMGVGVDLPMSGRSYAKSADVC